MRDETGKPTDATPWRVFTHTLVASVLFAVVNSFWADWAGFHERSFEFTYYNFWSALIIYLVVLSQQRVLWRGTLAVSFLLYAALAAGLVKFEVLGEMPRFSDLWSLGALITVVGWPLTISALGIFAATISVVAANWRFSPVGLGIFAAVVASVGALGYMHSRTMTVAESRHYTTPAPAVLTYGHIFAFVRDAAGYAARLSRMRDVAAASPSAASPAGLFPDRQLANPAPRDVHIVVVESFIDPGVLAGFRFTPSPLSPNLRALLGDRRRRALSPVTGGRSPDAEFEILCGLAALLDWREVVFNALTITEAECLPRKLARLGWHTMVTNPIPGHFFNSARVYGVIGFTDTAFAGDLDMRDLDGRYLSARATLDQHLERVRRARAAKRPVLSYVFPAASHLPYLRDEARRPTVIAVTPENALVEGFANALHYMMRAVEDHVAALFADDPAALVVIVGDHVPYLGPGVDIGAAPQRAALFEVPLIIFDGVSRAPSMGRAAHFEIPGLIAALLTAAGPCGPSCLPGATGIRPLAVGGFAFARDGKSSIACPAPRADTVAAAACRRVAAGKAGHVRHLWRLVE